MKFHGLSPPTFLYDYAVILGPSLLESRPPLKTVLRKRDKSFFTMPSVDREESRDRELVLKHQPSVSDSGRASVPM